MNQDVKYLDRAAAAELLQVSTKTIDRLRKSGELPWFNVLGGVRIPRAAVEDYVERGLAAAAPAVVEVTEPSFPIPALEQVRREKAARRAEQEQGDLVGERT